MLNWQVPGAWSRTGENPTYGVPGRAAGNVAMGAGLRPGAKALEEPPDPNVRALALYPTAGLLLVVGEHEATVKRPGVGHERFLPAWSRSKRLSIGGYWRCGDGCSTRRRGCRSAITRPLSLDWPSVPVWARSERLSIGGGW